MTYYRPLNSDESNLFVIRCSVDFRNIRETLDIDHPKENQIIVAGPNVEANISDYNALLSPNRNNLPEKFSIIMQQQKDTAFNAVNDGRNIDDTSNGTIYIQYGDQYVSIPTISILPNYTKGDSYVSFTKTNTDVGLRNSSVNPTIDTCQTRINFFSRFGNKIPFTKTDGLTGFDLIIMGNVRTGIATQHTNKGWSIVSGSDPREIYTRMTVKFLSPLDSFFYRSGLAIEGSNQHQELTPNDLMSEVLTFNPTLKIQLILPSANDLAVGIQNLKQYAIQKNDCFDLVIINKSIVGSANIELFESTDIKVIGNNIVHYRDDSNNAVSVGSGRYRILCEDSTPGSEKFQMIRIG